MEIKTVGTISPFTIRKQENSFWLKSVIQEMKPLIFTSGKMPEAKNVGIVSDVGRASGTKPD